MRHHACPYSFAIAPIVLFCAHHVARAGLESQIGACRRKACFSLESPDFLAILAVCVGERPIAKGAEAMVRIWEAGLRGAPHLGHEGRLRPPHRLVRRRRRGLPHQEMVGCSRVDTGRGPPAKPDNAGSRRPKMTTDGVSL